MTTSFYEIGPALPEDAEAIGVLRAKSWREEYGRLPGIDAVWIEGQFARIASAAGTEQRAKAIAESSQPGARHFWHVARLTLDHTIVGFVDARKLDDGSQEVHSIRIASEYCSRGIGQALMDTAHAWFDSDKPVFLDVAQDNKRAQAFYGRPSNNYRPTGHVYYYEQLGMMQMQREPHS